MLQKAVEIFKKIYDKYGNKYILDSYIPSDGTYVIVRPEDDNFVIEQIIEFKYDKKNKTIDRTIDNFEFICFADYHSKLVDMNKSILPSSGKVIQGNNYLSFITKKESIVNGKLSTELIENFYNILKNPEIKYSKPKAKYLYKIVEEKIGKVDIQRLEKIKTWISSNIFSILEENTGKDYLKIFFRYPEEVYEKEAERYFIPNIYNSNDYNIEIDGCIYGLPNDNLGMNSKKPYLENKTRKSMAPILLSFEQVMMQKKLFDYMMNQVSSGKNNIYIGEKILALSNDEMIDENFNGLYMRINKGTEVEIIDFDIIPNYNPKLIREFSYENVLDMDYDKLKGEYGRIKTLKAMQKLINEVLFSKFLANNYFTEAKDISTSDNALKCNLLLARTALFNWFYKGRGKDIWGLLNKVSLNLVKGSIINGYSIKAIDQFNLRISMKEYFEGGEKMADTILSIKDEIKTKIKGDTNCINSDDEYSFAVGQLVSFFISKSKGKKKPLSLANPFINARSEDVIKYRLKALYKKYNYDIESYSYKFKNLYAMVIGYNIENKINEDLIIAGFLHSNLIYEKNEGV